MAPPTKTPRLKDIDPEQLALAVEQAIKDHITSLCFHVGWVPSSETAIPQIKFSVADLVAYAANGTRLDAPVQEYLVSIAPPVWTRAADSGSYQTPEFDDSNVDALPDGWLGELILAMKAALAREAIGQKQHVDAADVAALASISSAQVRMLLRKGELKGEQKGDGWLVEAEDARQWLDARGVPGFAKTKPRRKGT